MSNANDKPERSTSGEEKIQFDLPVNQRNTEASAEAVTSASVSVSASASSPDGIAQLPLGERKLTSDSRLPEDLELSTYETRSIDERVPPWKHKGPWHKDVTRRRWVLMAIAGFLIVVIIVVVPIVVTKTDDDD